MAQIIALCSLTLQNLPVTQEHLEELTEIGIDLNFPILNTEEREIFIDDFIKKSQVFLELLDPIPIRPKQGIELRSIYD